MVFGPLDVFVASTSALDKLLLDLFQHLKDRDLSEIKKIIEKLKQPQFKDFARSDSYKARRKEVIYQLMECGLREHGLYRWKKANFDGDITEHTASRDEYLGYHRSDEMMARKSALLNFIHQTVDIFTDHFTLKIPIEKRIHEYERLFKNYIIKKGQYPSADWSDDSDSEDERTLEQGSINQRTRQFRKQQSYLTDDFWLMTRQKTPRNAGLTDKLAAVSEDCKIDNEPLKSFHQKLSQRAAITPNAVDTVLYQDLNNSDDFHGPFLRQKNYIALFRGVNYLKDRWTTAARRKHYYADDLGKPQFAEACYKHDSFSFDYTTEVPPTAGHYLDKANYQQLLSDAAVEIRKRYSKLCKSGVVIEDTVAPRKQPFLFSSKADWMQHEFSNGVNDHLGKLKQRLAQDEWKPYFVNAFNYAIACGNRPYHSLKYALGLKDYYPDAFDLQYDRDGRLVHSHAGKVWVLLISEDELKQTELINRVVGKATNGQVPIYRDILYELETSFIGYIPGDYIIHQQPIKFPSFHREWGVVQHIYPIKYGLTQPLYNEFKRLILQSKPLSDERKEVLKILKEWLAAFHEVMLMNIAYDAARERGGRLVYLDANDKCVLEPDGNPLAEKQINATKIILGCRYYIATLEVFLDLSAEQIREKIIGLLTQVNPANGQRQYKTEADLCSDAKELLDQSVGAKGYDTTYEQLISLVLTHIDAIVAKHPTRPTLPPFPHPDNLSVSHRPYTVDQVKRLLNGNLIRIRYQATITIYAISPTGNSKDMFLSAVITALARQQTIIGVICERDDGDICKKGVVIKKDGGVITLTMIDVAKPYREDVIPFSRLNSKSPLPRWICDIALGLQAHKQPGRVKIPSYMPCDKSDWYDYSTWLVDHLVSLVCGISLKQPAMVDSKTLRQFHKSILKEQPT